MRENWLHEERTALRSQRAERQVFVDRWLEEQDLVEDHAGKQPLLEQQHDGQCQEQVREAARIAEQKRLEQQRLDEEARNADELLRGKRLEEQKREETQAEAARLAEEERLEAHRRERQRLGEEEEEAREVARLAAEKRLEEKRLEEEADRLAEELRAADQEAARVADERLFSGFDRWVIMLTIFQMPETLWPRIMLCLWQDLEGNLRMRI